MTRTVILFLTTLVVIRSTLEAGEEIPGGWIWGSSGRERNNL